jgi:RNA polymerase sporulation-specific sigma factor
MGQVSGLFDNRAHHNQGEATLFLVKRAQRGDDAAMQKLIKSHYGFVRMKARAYFLVSGDSSDLIQEGLVGLYKAVRDFREDRGSSFINFADLCITRQILTAIKLATRQKHSPLNTYVSFSSTPAGEHDGDPTLEEVIAGPAEWNPVHQIASEEEIRFLVEYLSFSLTHLEAKCLSLHLEGLSYRAIGERIGARDKTVDNALQRVRRKVSRHIETRRVLDAA